MQEFITPLIEAARRLLTSPLSELNRWQLTARYAVGIARYGAHELKEDRASQMAAALTYRTIFSLIPLFVLSLLVFNAFGGFESVGGNLRETLYDYLGLSSIQLDDTAETPMEMDVAPGPPVLTPEGEPIPTTPDQVVPVAPAEESGAAETQARVDQLLTDLQNQVAEVNFTSIGLVGLALLIWAGLSLVVSLENCFNRIYHAPHGRPWHLRITIYWAVITLGPVLVALSFFMTNRLIETAQSLDAFGVVHWALSLLTPLASTAATWLLLVLIYKLLPNAKVQLRAALIGSLVAAVLWESSKWGFRFYVQRAVGYSALYGSLGLVPLFLLWMYLTWLIILFGLEISYVIQTVKDTRFIRAARNLEASRDTLVESHSVLAVAAALGRAFDRGEAVSVNDLTRRVRLPGHAVERLIQALKEAGLIHPEESGDDGPGDFRLSRPAEAIEAIDILRAGRAVSAAPAADDDHAAEVFDGLRQSQEQAITGQTLRGLIGPPPRDDTDNADTKPDANVS